MGGMLLALGGGVVLLSAAVLAFAQWADEPIALEDPAVQYYGATSANPVAALNERLAAGQSRLVHEEGSGYLRSLLAELRIPVESQLAVFSGASLQGRIIRPSNPRTIFFNDSVAVAWVRGGFVEIAAHDAAKGAVFYRLEQRPGSPSITRDNGCLSCHYSATTMGVPGFITRSVPAATDGAILPWLGNFLVDHRTPIGDRWGGFYVTGRLASGGHLGNAPIADKRLPALRPADAGPVLDDLRGRFDVSGYLSPQSDVVALLVFEHQAHAMNLLSRLTLDARVAARRGQAGDTERLRSAVVELVDYLLFVDEAPLPAVTSASPFARVFAARGLRDTKGRSLRDLDLRRRLLKYPCSYMVYSDAFDALPTTIKEAVYRRLSDVLSGREKAPKYARLSAADRRAVGEILRDTKESAASYFEVR